jgi:hypothetical protein
VRRIGGPPARPLLGRGVEKNLDLRGREHDRPDVAAFHDDAPRGAKRALPRDERLAHRRVARDDRRRRIDLLIADRGGDIVAVDADSTVADLEPRPAGERGHRGLLRRIDPVFECLPRQRAVHRARVDVAVAEPRRHRARNRALAGA